MNKKFLTKILSIFIGITLGVSLVISGCSVSSKKDSAQVPNGQAVASANKTKNEKNISGGRNTAIVQAAKKVGPAVVGITNKAFVRDFFNRVQLTERGTGSGVIYSKDGLIATNNHG